jgi:phage portal protein BeeE
VADVARIFQVPPFMLADPSRSTFASAREGTRHFAMMCLSPWGKKLERAFARLVLSTQFRLVIDLGDLLPGDPEARWASWQRARQAGVLSPNDVRLEEGWPRSTDPTAHSIEPPAACGKPVGDEPVPKPAADDDESDKTARLAQRR